MYFNKTRKREKNEDPFVIKTGKYERVEGISYREKWTEESFLTVDKGRETLGRTFNFSRINLIFYVLSFFISVIAIRAAWLQIVKGDYYYRMAEGNRIRIERVETKRGIIYDRNNNPLTRNIANFLLYFIPADLPKEDGLDAVIQEVSRILGDKSAEDIKEMLSKVKMGSLESFQPLFIADDIEYEKAMLLYLKSDEWPGVVITSKSRREYELYTPSLSHVLGYTGKINPEELKKFGSEYLQIDYIGKMGIEYFWEPDLKGINGKKQIEVDALGKEKKVINETRPEDGHNLVLSIDTLLQKKLEEALSNALTKLKLKRGAGIVMNPNNGEVLALVSLPTYNNNTFARGITSKEYRELISHPDKPLFNRSISGEYPSGSTIKPVIAAAALEERIINEHTTFLSVGGIRIGQWFFPDWKAGGHGRVSVRRAIAESVNTFFYYIGGGYGDFTGLGVDRIVEYGKQFGLGAQSGIDLPGESSGFLPTKKWKEETKGERWYIGDTYHLAIGQGDILVTPLQVAVFTSVFANGGKLYRPHIVKEVLSNSDELIREIGTEPIREGFINSYNIQVVREGMRQAVTHGSARSLGDLPIAVAGKTGTAQWSSKRSPHAWFTGFAPYENPEIVITVLVEEGGEGSSVAVPIAKEVLRWYFGEYTK
jgi:penicillin-binding protein 2